MVWCLVYGPRVSRISHRLVSVSQFWSHRLSTTPLSWPLHPTSPCISGSLQSGSAPTSHYTSPRSTSFDIPTQVFPVPFRQVSANLVGAYRSRQVSPGPAYSLPIRQVITGPYISLPIRQLYPHRLQVGSDESMHSQVSSILTSHTCSGLAEPDKPCPFHPAPTAPAESVLIHFTPAPTSHVLRVFPRQVCSDKSDLDASMLCDKSTPYCSSPSRVSSDNSLLHVSLRDSPDYSSRIQPDPPRLTRSRRSCSFLVSAD